MSKFIKYVEQFIIWGILIVMSVILVLAFIDIVYEITKKIMEEPIFIIDSSGLMGLFSLFLVLLIGLELLETVKAYCACRIYHIGCNYCNCKKSDRLGF